MNHSHLEWDTIAVKRRKFYFQELKANHKFTKIFTKVKKSVFEEGETYKQVLHSEKSTNQIKLHHFIFKIRKKRLEKLRV